MQRITFITPRLAVAGQITADDLAQIAQLGIRTVIGNRPDDEEPGQPTAAEIEAASKAEGLDYRYIPAFKHEVLDDHVLDPLADALAEFEAPVLLHCRSGMRSTIMWAALAIDGGMGVAQAIAAAAAAGQDISAVKDELTERAEARAVKLGTDKTQAEAA